MSATKTIDAFITRLGDWRGARLSEVRQAILACDPGITEEWKYMGSPVFYLDGMLCVADAYKTQVKVIFAKGASLADPKKLFNAELEGTTRRAIQYLEGSKFDKAGFQGLIKAAMALNRSKPAKPRPKPGAKKKVAKTAAAKR